MKKVLLLLAEGFELYEASAFIDVIGWNQVDGDGSTQLFTCGLRSEIKSSFNHRMIVDYVDDEINVEEFDALAIPGGFKEFNFYRDAYDERFLNLIRMFNAQNKPISSVCVAALPIARSGILANRRATTYNKNPLRVEELLSYNVEVIDEPIVTDSNITTSWNPAMAIDVAFRLLEELTSRKQSEFIRGIMGFNRT